MDTLARAVPTGAIYTLHAPQETRAERLPAIDVEHLIGALHRDPVGHTDVTPMNVRLLGAASGSGFDVVVAYKGSGKLLLAEMKPFESTPSTIEQSRGVAVRTERRASDPPAYEAFKTLGRWLNADDAAIADMVGVGRTTAYTWKRDGREPRAATSQRIYEYHATLDALSRRLGVGGLRRWLHEGLAPRRDVLLAGDLERLERDVHEVLFRRAPIQRVDLAAAAEDTTPTEVSGSERSLRPSGRRPRRSRR
jgi:hypothetical protein